MHAEGVQRVVVTELGFERAASEVTNDPRSEAHRDRFPCPVLAPTTAQIELLFDKSRTLALAESVGLRVPRTEVVKAGAEIDEVVDRVRLPAIEPGESLEILLPRRPG